MSDLTAEPSRVATRPWLERTVRAHAGARPGGRNSDPGRRLNPVGCNRGPQSPNLRPQGAHRRTPGRGAWTPAGPTVDLKARSFDPGRSNRGPQRSELGPRTVERWTSRLEGWTSRGPTAGPNGWVLGRWEVEPRETEAGPPDARIKRRPEAVSAHSEDRRPSTGCCPGTNLGEVVRQKSLAPQTDRGRSASRKGLSRMPRNRPAMRTTD